MWRKRNNLSVVIETWSWRSSHAASLSMSAGSQHRALARYLFVQICHMFWIDWFGSRSWLIHTEQFAPGLLCYDEIQLGLWNLMFLHELTFSTKNQISKSVYAERSKRVVCRSMDCSVMTRHNWESLCSSTNSRVVQTLFRISKSVYTEMSMRVVSRCIHNFGTCKNNATAQWQLPPRD